MILIVEHTLYHIQYSLIKLPFVLMVMLPDTNLDAGLMYPGTPIRHRNEVVY